MLDPPHPSDPTPPFSGLAEVVAQNHLHWTDAVTRRDFSVRCLSMQCFAERLTRYQRAVVGSYQQAIHLTSPPLKLNLTSWPPCTIFGSPHQFVLFPITFKYAGPDESRSKILRRTVDYRCLHGTRNQDNCEQCCLHLETTT